ncbi:aldehyde dehydrogenase family protein (plasmid) [Rhizobium sp. CB3171]|uniref:aldehyde dehydrogenase family protein n=1 Tax=Rhizobium sp. CB3171 TaxID=3039157 RepID=UPI0024B11393|nr:aldehyde dehydrogenase family protein [Rhizobium sp. CB3171]WFU05098.1 aldehyde dehydrogenase family protein [Rhizobium sp. CB3171]
MIDYHKFYIDGAWIDPEIPSPSDVINPATETAWSQISLGSKADVYRAVAAAKAAFPSFSLTTRDDRIDLLKRVLAAYDERYEDIAQAVTNELGAPITWSRSAQTWAGQQHLIATIKALEQFHFEERRGSSMVLREPIGVCALITPWNWPLNQIVCKVAPALAAGCTVVLKPSEIAPISGLIFAEVMHAAGVPKGVFNLVNGNGPDVGQVMSGHPDVDMVSFTGSTRAGIIVAKTAAETVKRVAQELGGKSANIVLPDADLAVAVAEGTRSCFSNTGQSCDAPTRMLVPADRHDEALAIAAHIANSIIVGDPKDPGVEMGPLVSKLQFEKVKGLIRIGIDEGATLAAGGTESPKGLSRGYFVKPTVFGNVRPGMAIEREEIFGPVLCIIPYRDVDDAVRIANDTVYGLAAYVQGSPGCARSVARRLRVGQVQINYPSWDLQVPFGGYKQSGNGREYADWAIHDFCELKGIVGYGA